MENVTYSQSRADKFDLHLVSYIKQQQIIQNLNNNVVHKNTKYNNTNFVF